MVGKVPISRSSFADLERSAEQCTVNIDASMDAIDALLCTTEADLIERVASVKSLKTDSLAAQLAVLTDHCAVVELAQKR